MANSVVITQSLKKFADNIQKQVKKDYNDSLYAAQQALNNTAFKARENLFHAYQGTFDIHNKNFFTTNLRKGVIVKKASKKIDGEKMQVQIVFPFDWFKIQSFGGVKTVADLKKQSKLNMLAIPTSRGSIKLNQSGRITGAGVNRMLEYSFKNPKKTKSHVTTPHAFIMKGVTSKGKDVVAKRNKFNRKEIFWYFVLQPELKVRKNWDFYGIITKTFNRHLDSEFEKAFKWTQEHPKK